MNFNDIREVAEILNIVDPDHQNQEARAVLASYLMEPFMPKVEIRTQEVAPCVEAEEEIQLYAVYDEQVRLWAMMDGGWDCSEGTPFDARGRHLIPYDIWCGPKAAAEDKLDDTTEIIVPVRKIHGMWQEVVK